jgi:hypothetical protein
MTLSPAQHQQRRDAANARWAHARAAAAALAGGAAGAGLGYAAVNAGVTAVRRRQLDAKNAALTDLRNVFRRHKAAIGRINARAAEQKKALASEKTFISAAARGYETKARVARRFLHDFAQHKAKNTDTYFDAGETIEVSNDMAGEIPLRSRLLAVNADDAPRFGAMAADLRAKGKSPRKVNRKGAFHHPKVEEFSRDYKAAPRISVSNIGRENLESLFAEGAAGIERDDDNVAFLRNLGVHSVDDLARYMGRLSPKDRKYFSGALRNELGIAGVGIVRPKQRTTVENTIRYVPAHSTTVPGYPSASLKAKIREELTNDIRARRLAGMVAAGEAYHAGAEAARAVSAGAGPALRYLGPSVRRTLGRVGLGVGLLGGAFAAARAEQAFEHSRPLAKGDPQDSSPPPGKSTGERLITAAENVEASLARGVNKALVGWRDLVTPESVMAPNSQGGLFEGLDAPLAAGMAPLDDATSDGLTAPASIIPPDDGSAAGGDGPKILRFGFDLRAQGVEDFARRYRMDRVREISNGQRATLRQLIADASTSGTPPAETARKIRDVIGLTSYQAAIVQNYRKMLETNDARALTFALRDRRFDRTVARAVNDAGDLTPAQVDKMTAVYRARMIASRAVTIARTESLRATNNAHATSVANWLGKNPGYTTIKVWMATDDDRTRHDHRLLNGQHVVGMRTPFVCDDGSTLLWPHDPKGTAAQVVRCRCAFATVLIPRAQTGFFDPGFFSQNGAFNGPSTPYDEPTPDQIFGSPEMQPA